MPSGIVRQVPGASSTISDRSPWLRHISPRPPTMYQISSTVRWRTAVDTRPGASSKWAIPPAPTCRSTRTSDPSGAIVVGCAGRRIVSNPGMGTS